MRFKHYGIFIVIRMILKLTGNSDTAIINRFSTKEDNRIIFYGRIKNRDTIMSNSSMAIIKP